MRPRKTSDLTLPFQPEAPGHATVLAEIGPETKEAVKQLMAVVDSSPLLSQRWRAEGYRMLADALPDWKDGEAAQVVHAVRERLQFSPRDRDQSETDLDLTLLSRWIRAQPDDARSVRDCLNVNAPEEITIIKVLSRAGSQKVVFLANWRIAQREVVLKRFIGTEAARRLIPRELQPHPLSMSHTNIIETHFVQNTKNERFLVERRLPQVLSDSWSAGGLHEAANLLYDIANALAFLSGRQLVHGDVKPDNIGYEDGNYILLDFGICRPAEDFAEDSTPTGSLRTRAPELLLGEGKHSHSADVWALAATVFNAIAGRFPLFDVGEVPPRVWDETKRAEFEGTLAARARNEWGARVNVTLIPEPLRDVLAKALNRDPGKRSSASDLAKLCEKELAAFLRGGETMAGFSPARELAQLKAHLPPRQTLELMPYSQKLQLKELLKRLGAAKGLSKAEEADVKELITRIG